MTFDKAYCKELDKNITSYKARIEYFAKEDDEKFEFLCPDENCRVEFSGVNIYTVGEFKNRPHFKTKNKCKHTKDCKIIKENTETTEEEEGEERKVHGKKGTKHPNIFILKRPKQETTDRGMKEESEDDDPYYQIRRKREKRTSTEGEVTSPHTTSYLENVVDSFEDMNEKELKESFINLNKSRRSYKNTFKNIKYAEKDGTNYIFYGEIKPIKKYGNNYAINFEEQIWFNGGYKNASIYIKNDLIEKYRLRRLFKKTIEHLIEFNEKYKSARCYFVGAYPVEETIKLKNGNTFNTLNIYIENLDHFVIKFSKSKEELKEK